jgi:hypothetical protein
MLRDLIQLMFIGLAFLLPITAPASTTYPVANRTVVEQIISAYDADSVHSISDNVWAGSEAMAQPVTFFGSVGGLVAAKSTSKGVQLVEDIVGPNAKATLNEAGDLVIESQNGLTKVRFVITVKGDIKFRNMIADRIGGLTFTNDDLKQWEAGW